MAPPPEPEPLPDLGPTELVLPEGASAVLVVRPVEVFASPPLREIFEVLFPPSLRDAFARRTGVEPEEVEHLAVGEYEDGYVALARGPWPAADVVRGAEVRMNQIEFAGDDPWERRTGWIGTERYELAAIRPQVLMVANGASPAVHGSLYYARHGAHRDEVRPAVAPALPLVREHQDAPFVIYAPRHLELPPGFGAALLLARQETLAITLRPMPDDPERLLLTADLRGTFPPNAGENFRAWVEAIGASDLGRALGIEAGLPTLTIESADEAVVLRMALRATTVAQGLLVLFGGELRELLAAGPAGI